MALISLDKTHLIIFGVEHLIGMMNPIFTPGKILVLLSTRCALVLCTPHHPLGQVTIYALMTTIAMIHNSLFVRNLDNQQI